MTESRTIDDLGIETSTRWASDQAVLDKTLIQEAATVSRQTKIDVYQPFYKSEFDLIFETKKRHKQWAAFFPPRGYSFQKMHLFTYQIIPSLGTEEFQQAQMQKIKDRREANKNKRKQQNSSTQTTRYAWEDKREEEQEHKESETLLHLMNFIHGLDQLLIIINARRSQYSKG